MACLRESKKNWLCADRSKLADALASRSIGHDAGSACRSVGCSLAIVTRNDFDCVHEMASKSSVINSRKNGLRSFSGDQERQALSRRAPDAPALVQSMITLPHDMLSLCSFHDKLRHEQSFPFVCLSKQ